MEPQNKANNITTFDHVDVKKHLCEIDGFRYPKDGVLTNFSQNDYLNQFRDLNLFYKNYFGEEFMKRESYKDMKNKYPIHKIDLRHQVDNITPEVFQLFEEYKIAPVYSNIRLYVILIRHRQIEMV